MTPVPDRAPTLGDGVRLWRFEEKVRNTLRHHHYEQPTVYSNGAELTGVEGRWFTLAEAQACINGAERAQAETKALREDRSDPDCLLALAVGYADTVRDEGVGFEDADRFEKQVRAFAKRVDEQRNPAAGRDGGEGT